MNIKSQLANARGRIIRKFELYIEVSENLPTGELCNHIKTSLIHGVHTVQKVQSVKAVLRARRSSLINNTYKDEV